LLDWSLKLKEEEKPMSKYEKDMKKPISDSKSLQGAKKPSSNSSTKAPKQPFDASKGMYLKKGGKVGKKKMALGGAAKVRKGMTKD
jgi:hypothetical protein